MTDTPRSWKRPVEEVARAMWRAREMQEPDARLRRPEPDAMDMSTGTFARVYVEAKAALTHLTALGFLTIECLEAIKAEQEGMK